MNISRNVKISIIAGLIAMILFVYCVQPFLSLCGKFIINVFSKFSSAYTNSAFKKAASMSPERPAFILFSLSLGLLTGIIIASYVGLLLSFVSWLRKKEILKPKPWTKKSVIKMLILSCIFLIWFIFAIVAFYWQEWFQVTIITSFRQHIHTLAPYLSEDEEEIFWSQWAQMRNRTDYEEIYKRLNKIAKKNDIKLPENYAYSLKGL